jgi:hypothetical protein
VTTLESTTERLEAALRRLAVMASDLFEDLLRQGAELPFDLEPTQGEGPLPMFQYSPMTGEFINRHMAELRRLDAFVEVRELAGEEAATGFLIGLWEGRSEFDVAGDRLEGAIAGVLASVSSPAADGSPVGEVLVPLIGFHMPAESVTVDGVRIVRADSVADAPYDAVEKTRGPGGKPGFLAMVSCNYSNVAPAAAVADDLSRMLRTLRLFRPGAVGLAPHGWARRAEGWERFGTGASRPRHGGYRLTGNEVADLEAFSRRLTERGARMPSLSWAISRFDLGAERASLIEALSDYLLALRGLLEGGGSANLGLTARVAILAAEPFEREQARITVERALTIERKLMSGARYRPTAGSSPLGVIGDLEELLRRILNKLATGELEGDLREQADERLLAEGLRAADTAQPDMGETAEWRLPDLDDLEAELDLSAVADGNIGDIEVRRTSGVTDDEESETPTEADIPQAEVTHGLQPHAPAQDPPTRIEVPDVELPEIMAAADHPGPSAEREERPKADWFAAGEGDGEVDWPAFASPRRDSAEKRELSDEAADRVRYLFPVPDATDWDVGELRYERRSSS